MSLKQDLMKPPNMVSAIRLLIAPLLLVLALAQLEYWFLGALIFSALTDVVDGYIARRYGMITPLGAHLDSWGDAAIYSMMAVCAWILWPDITQRELLYYSMILFSFLLPALTGLVKFGRMTGYHTWGVKIAVFATFVGYIALYADVARWPFVLAAILAVIAGVEEILITLVLREEKTDVRSLLDALRNRD